MEKKKIVMSLTASAVVASSFFATDKVNASSTHKVQSGDTLWSIAQKYNITVSQLKSLNKLSNDIIIPNQVLKVNSVQTTNIKNSQTTQTKKNTSKQPNHTYTVKSGDTLSRIANMHNVSIQDLMKWNNLNSTLIFPGNVLTVNQKSGTTEPSQPTPNIEKPNQTNNVTYTVKSGDTLSNIARQYQTTVENIKKWNSLTSDLIFVGQKLFVQESGVITTNNKNNKENYSSSNRTTYIVKSGDTLSQIARSYNVTVNNLKEWNNLTTDNIHIGQKLNINGKNSSNETNSSIESEVPTDITYNVNQLVSRAKQALGTKYTWGGQTLNGFDCSGFLYWAYSGSGMNVNRLSTEGYYSRSYYVNQPQIGDLVFFKDTYRSGISHAGIYIGNNEFIHAGTSTGVTIANLNNPYWKKHFDSFKRFY